MGGNSYSCIDTHQYIPDEIIFKMFNDIDKIIFDKSGQNQNCKFVGHLIDYVKSMKNANESDDVLNTFNLLIDKMKDFVIDENNCCFVKLKSSSNCTEIKTMNNKVVISDSIVRGTYKFEEISVHLAKIRSAINYLLVNNIGFSEGSEYNEQIKVSITTIFEILNLTNSSKMIKYYCGEFIDLLRYQILQKKGTIGFFEKCSYYIKLMQFKLNCEKKSGDERLEFFLNGENCKKRKTYHRMLLELLGDCDVNEQFIIEELRDQITFVDLVVYKLGKIKKQFLENEQQKLLADVIGVIIIGIIQMKKVIDDRYNRVNHWIDGSYQSKEFNNFLSGISIVGKDYLKKVNNHICDQMIQSH